MGSDTDEVGDKIFVFIVFVIVGIAIAVDVDVAVDVEVGCVMEEVEEDGNNGIDFVAVCDIVVVVSELEVMFEFVDVIGIGLDEIING